MLDRMLHQWQQGGAPGSPVLAIGHQKKPSITHQLFTYHPAPSQSQAV